MFPLVGVIPAETLSVPAEPEMKIVSGAILGVPSIASNVQEPATVPALGVVTRHMPVT